MHTFSYIIFYRLFQVKATALKIFLAVAFLLCEILPKISHSFSKENANASDGYIRCRRIMETGQAFEPQSGETLLDGLYYFAEPLKLQSDAFSLIR